MADCDEIRLILRPLSDSRPWPIRLRQALKTLLRRDRLACVRFEQLPAHDNQRRENDSTG